MALSRKSPKRITLVEALNVNPQPQAGQWRPLIHALTCIPQEPGLSQTRHFSCPLTRPIVSMFAHAKLDTNLFDVHSALKPFAFIRRAKLASDSCSHFIRKHCIRTLAEEKIKSPIKYYEREDTENVSIIQTRHVNPSYFFSFSRQDVCVIGKKYFVNKLASKKIVQFLWCRPAPTDLNHNSVRNLFRRKMGECYHAGPWQKSFYRRRWAVVNCSSPVKASRGPKASNREDPYSVPLFCIDAWSI